MANFKKTVIDGEFILGKHQIKLSNEATIYYSEVDKKFWFLIDDKIVATLDSTGLFNTGEAVEGFDN